MSSICQQNAYDGPGNSRGTELVYLNCSQFSYRDLVHLSPSSLSADGYIQSSSLIVFVNSRSFFTRCSCRSANIHHAISAMIIILHSIQQTYTHTKTYKVRSNYFIVHPKVDQRAGLISLPHLGIFTIHTR